MLCSGMIPRHGPLAPARRGGPARPCASSMLSATPAISVFVPALSLKICPLFSYAYSLFHFPYTTFFYPSSLLSISSAIFPKNTGVCPNSSQNGTTMNPRPSNSAIGSLPSPCRGRTLGGSVQVVGASGPGFAGKRLDRCVHQEGIVEFRLLAGQFPGDGEEPRRERLVPFHGERGHVPDDACELIQGRVARQRHRIKSCPAHRGIRQQRINRDAPFAPALGQPRILEHRQHQSRVAHLLHAHVFDRGGDCRRRRQRADGAKGPRGQILDRKSTRLNSSH